MNRHYFTRWLRSKQLPLLLSFMLVALAAVQSLHEQLEHHGEPSPKCEYCILAHTSDAGLIPLVITLPVAVADYAPSILAQAVAPLATQYALLARGPPASSSHF